MALASALRLWLACLLLCIAAPKPTCDPSACSPCPEEGPEGTPSPSPSPSPGGCCPPCPPPCPCPPHLRGDCEMQGFAGGRVPAGRSFYIDFARKLCRCLPAGDIACAPLCPAVPPGCLALGSPVADGCPRCVCYGHEEEEEEEEEEVVVLAGSVIARGSQICSCPEHGGRLQCRDAGSQE